MIRFKAGIARTIGRLSRATGKGGGTTLPGRVLLKLDPDAIDKLGSGLKYGSTLISATNGKTTTASMLASILAAAGRHPVHNRSGSNMTWGVATALLEEKGDEGLFEVDEAWLPETASRLHPNTILLGNLFRDQLDRYGETEALADAWVKLAGDLDDRTSFVLNADDPLVADIGRYSGEGTEYFGIDDDSQALAELQHAHDAKQCRVCGHALEYQRAFVGHLGHYSCPNCGMKRPAPEVSAREIALKGMSGLEATIVTPEGSARLKLPLPGLYNLYNALGAIATARKLGIPVESSTASLAGMKAVFGRVERIQIDRTELSILLIKNPAGANEVIRTLALEPGQLDLWIALNDRIADGRDVSWIWDADFEMLAGKVESVVCTGTRGSEMALRLKYAGWDTDRIEVVDGLETALGLSLRSGPEKLFAMPTYTALIEMRQQLADQGDAGTVLGSLILADLDSDEASIWQLVESCAYRADLEIWSEITAGSASILDLGCGIGRVARYLAAEGKSVLGVDRDPEMVADLNRLATEERVAAITGDVTEIGDLDLGRDTFETILAPQQLLHILGGESDRRRLLAGVKRRLAPEGVAAFAISEFILDESQAIDILPDVREIGEWVYASRPVAIETETGALRVIRLRQVIAPDGSLEETRDPITLDVMDRDSFTRELAAEGLRVDRMIELPETDRHIASVVVVARHVGFPG